MYISYKVNNNYLLHSINLPLQPGKALLITGVENSNLNLLGGIIGKLFPIKAKIDIPEINALTTNFTGELETKNGNLPQNVAYLSADPDRHFLFATVKEELSLVSPNNTNHIQLLTSFGLDESFYERKIATLSGGEKMKVALVLAFARQADCYVFHGVIPWLDQAGRNLLMQHIQQCKNNNIGVVFIEHEIDNLINAVDEVFWFDGQIIIQYSQNYSTTIEQPKLVPTESAAKLLEFTNVALTKHPFFEESHHKSILNNISFRLNTNNIYALAGDNGSGKSTIAQMLFRIIKPTAGTINLLEQPLMNYSRAQLNELICYVSQFPAQQITASTVGQYQTKSQQENNLLVQGIFKQYLNLPANTPVASLTSLQMKLLVLANCINNKTRLIILDEPTWGIDKMGQKLFWQIVQTIRQQLAATLFLISHDINLIKQLTAKVIYLTDGKANSNF